MSLPNTMRYLRADTIRAADLYAYCPVFESAQEPVIKHRGRDVIMLGTNSYLGLATHPLVKECCHAKPLKSMAAAAQVHQC